VIEAEEDLMKDDYERFARYVNGVAKPHSNAH